MVKISNHLSSRFCSHTRRGLSKCRWFGDFTWILGLVGDDAADKVRLSAAEVSHQLIKILLQVNTHTDDVAQCHMTDEWVNLHCCSNPVS